MPIQQMLLGAGGATDKYYIDDVFSMAPYKGTAANNTINNGINLSEDGGLVWLKNRSGSYYNIWHDTEQGVNKSITPQSAMAQSNDGSSRLNQFKTNGFRVGSDTTVNASGNDIMSWCFKKSQGFFDIVKWTGNSTARTINHNLKCIPGFIAVKSMTEGGNWNVYHRGVNQGINPLNYYLILSGSGGAYSNVQPFTAVTDTGFSIIADDNNDEAYYMNKSGEEYQAYVFAGGESTAATARSVAFQGSNDYLLVGSSSDFTMGTGDFTVEGWIKYDSISHKGVFQITDESDGFQSSNHNDSIALGLSGSATGATWRIYGGGGSGTVTTAAQSIVGAHQWYHFAYVRSSGVTKLYINGTEVLSKTDTHDYNGTYLNIGGYYDQSSYTFDGKLSNFRVVKGTAVYTSSFRPPTEPLTNITNTKLLCCNNSSETGSTVTPTTITVQETGSEGITASTDSPFDDPGNFIFGDSGDQNVIKTNYYIGNGDDTSPLLEVDLGFEPQFVWIKNISSTERWYVFDSMRKMDNSEMDNTDTSGRIRSDNSAAEVTDAEGINVSAKGFTLTGNEDSTNKDGDTYIYIAVRASEGYVGKVPDAGTDVFSMDTGSASSDIPTFDSGFPVDMRMLKYFASSGNWYLGTRLMGEHSLYANTENTENTDTWAQWDSNKGDAVSWGSNEQAWQWKRHAGFDVLAYKAVGGTASYAHSLGKIPEMIWIKRRDSGNPWSVYHKGLNGGSSPEGYGVQLNTDAAEASSTSRWANTAPTSTHFFAGNNTGTNAADSLYIAMLFASVDKISKVGYYTGNGTTDGSHEITLGFTPRFLIIKCVTSGVSWAHWLVWDSLRDLDGSGNEKYLKLNSNGTQVGDYDYLDTTATGFKFNTNYGPVNGDGNKMIYYAHA